VGRPPGTAAHPGGQDFGVMFQRYG
jgi:hypothetical protein